MMVFLSKFFKTSTLFLFIVVFAGQKVLSDDTCMFSFTANDVPPNIVLLLDNGAEVEQIVWHSDYENTKNYTPTKLKDAFDNDGDGVINETDGSEGFSNGQGYAIINNAPNYSIVEIQSDLTPKTKKDSLFNSSGTTTIDGVVWAEFTVNGETRWLPAVPSSAVDDTWDSDGDGVWDGVKDNATIFRYSANYLNWIFFDSYVDVPAGNSYKDLSAIAIPDGSDLPDKSRFYYAKQAIFTVAKMTQRQAYFSIYAFEATSKGASNVQPLGFVYDVAGSVDSSFVNNVNNLGTFNYSPLAEGLASVGGYYASPSSGVVGEYCQQNFVIVITSGLSSEDQAAAAGSSPSSLSDYDGDSYDALASHQIPLDTGYLTVPTNINGSLYLDDVAHYLYENDIVDYQPGFQNVFTYTIGFMGNPETNAYLINASNNGNGNLNLYTTSHEEYSKYHFEAEDPDELSEQLLDAINSILSMTSSFTAPVVPVTRTTSGNQIYLAFFKPLDDTNFWEGNVTKFGLSEGGKILNANSTTEATWPNGAIKEDAVPYWATIDWADDSAGNLPPNGNGVNNSARKIYTYLGTNKVLTDPSNAFSTATSSLTADGDSNGISDILETYVDASGPVELTNITGTFSDDDTISGQDSGASATIGTISGTGTLTVTYTGKNALDFRTGEVVINGSGAAGTITTAGTSEVINYIRGADVLDEDGDGNVTENRRLICGDPLHSEPVVVNYGDTDGNPDTDEKKMVFFGANDGMLHAVNDEDGTEAWSFIPPDLLPNLKNILESSSHQYYVDSSPAIMRKDYNGNGTIDLLPTFVDGVNYPADKVYLVCGERKGGNSYFALDISDPANPEFLWRIAQTSGTPAATTVISELGESWSVPSFTVVKTTAADPGTDVVIIGGGYSPTNAKGRTVLIINADTGAIVRQFTLADNADMIYSIPSKIYLLDRDFNGIVDKMYVGDMGGQLWRIGKLDPTAFPDFDEDVSQWEVYKLFTARCGESVCDDSNDNNGNGLTDTADPSKFFYPPTVTLENAADLVFIGSGDRENACSTDDYNALYAIKDVHSDLSVPSLNLSDLADADTTSITYSEPDIWGGDDGWYLVMDPGEKGLAESIVFNKALYATTFLPNNEPCVPGGYAKLYALNYLTGAPKFDLDGDGSTGSNDVSKVIGGGIPSRPVIVITKGNVAELLISTSSTIPDIGSLETTAGVLTIALDFPDVNFHLLWWKEMF